MSKKFGSITHGRTAEQLKNYKEHTASKSKALSKAKIEYGDDRHPRTNASSRKESSEHYKSMTKGY